MTESEIARLLEQRRRNEKQNEDLKRFEQEKRRQEAENAKLKQGTGSGTRPER